MRIQPMGRGFKVIFFVTAASWTADRQVAHLERRVRQLKREVGADPDPEETSRRRLIWQDSSD